MDDATFLRNFADRDRVVLLAGGIAVPLPLSVMDDPELAGAAFRINLISPEGAESGDRRTFQPGTIEVRDLPLPLLWQWQLDDGHKTAVVVGRIDHIERTPDGLGNARGVFDTGPWGREAERMVRNRMLRGISGDYSNFVAEIVEKIEDRDERILDDKVSVQRSKLVAATIVAKPAFEDCYIEILDEETFFPDGILEGLVPITASASLRPSVPAEMLERLRRLEELEQEQLALTASAARERMSSYRLQREREQAIARIRGMQNITAAWKPMDSKFLSAKAKLQPRDSKGRWIEIGSMVRWHGGSERTSGVEKGGKSSGKHAPYKQGRVKSFDADSGEYTIEPLDGSPSVKLEGKNVEVVKAVIPGSPDEAAKINGDLDAATQNLIRGTDEKLGGSSGKSYSLASPEADPPKADAPDTAQETGFETDSATPADVSVGLDRLHELLGVEIEQDSGPTESDRQARKREQREAKDIAQAAEDARLWPDRETMGRQLFNNLGRPNETWEKDGEKYMRAGDRLRKIGDSPLISKKRRGWIQNTYGKDADTIDPKVKSYSMKLDQDTSKSFDKDLSDLGNQYQDNEVGPLAKALASVSVNDTPDTPDASTPDAPAADANAPETPATDNPVAQDAVKVMGNALVEAIKALNTPKGSLQDQLESGDMKLTGGDSEPQTPLDLLEKYKGNFTEDEYNSAKEALSKPDAPATTEVNGYNVDEKGTVHLKQGQSISLTNPPKLTPAPASAPEPAAPSGNITEMAKTMFENLHPDASWDDTDQATWIDAVKKAQETKNAA